MNDPQPLPPISPQRWRDKFTSDDDDLIVVVETGPALAYSQCLKACNGDPECIKACAAARAAAAARQT